MLLIHTRNGSETGCVTNANGRSGRARKIVTGEPCGDWELFSADPKTQDGEELLGACLNLLFPQPSSLRVRAPVLLPCWDCRSISIRSPEIAPLSARLRRWQIAC